MPRNIARTTMWVALAALLGQAVVRGEHSKPVAVAKANQKVQAVSTSLPAPKRDDLFRHNSYPDAWTAAQKSNRPILIYVSMPRCPHCEKMLEKTYERAEVGHLVADSFEPVSVSRSTHAKLVQKLNVKWYPTTVLVGPNNKVLDVIEGYVDAKTFKQRLQTGLAAVNAPTQTR